MVKVEKTSTGFIYACAFCGRSTFIGAATPSVAPIPAKALRKMFQQASSGRVGYDPRALRLVRR
jgi:hypothetical protein